MKFTLQFEVGTNGIATAEDLRFALEGIANNIAGCYGDQDLRTIPWGPLDRFDGQHSDVLAKIGPVIEESELTQEEEETFLIIGHILSHSCPSGHPLHKLAQSFLTLTNKLNANNPNFTPYKVDRDAHTS